MTVEQLEAAYKKLETYKRAKALLEKYQTIRGATLYYAGHTCNDIRDDEETAAIRQALFDRQLRICDAMERELEEMGISE